MTSEERHMLIISKIWYWLPARWLDGSSWFEIADVQVTGDEETGGADVEVSKDGAAPVTVSFTNDELYGDAMMSVNAARARVTGV